MGGVADSSLPPGFRFHPTDEELIVCYLIKKVENNNYTVRAIGDVDLNKSEPWELPDKAKMGEKEWYFFTLRDRKYPTGMRTNRATEAGYWKATGKDRDITRSGSNQLVGAKKTLVFYRGRAPKGLKTNWIMHEYRLEGEAALLHHNSSSSSSRIGMASKESEWVVCRIFQKSHGGGKKVLYTKDSCSKPSASNANSSSFGIACDDFSDTHSSLPPLLESPPPACDDYYQPPSLRAHHHHSWSNPTSTTTTATTLDHHHHHHHGPPDSSPGCFRFPSLPPAYEVPTYDMSKLKQEFNEVLARPCKLEASSASSFNWESLVDSINNQQQQQQQQPQQQQQQHLQQQQTNGDTTGLTEILNASNNSSLYRTTSTAELESLWTY